MFASLLAQAALAALPSPDLKGCQAFAKTFDNTCRKDRDGNPVAVANFLKWDSQDVDQMSCKGRIRCPEAQGEEDFTDSNPCRWNRKLCVSCSEDAQSKHVYIKVQSNALPNHCFASAENNARSQDTEWEVIWQPDVSQVQNFTK